LFSFIFGMFLFVFCLFFTCHPHPGRDVVCPEAQHLVYSTRDRTYVDVIDRAYTFASRVLLDLLMHEKQLVERLR